MNTKKIPLLSGVIVVSIAIGITVGWLLKDTLPPDVAVSSKEKKVLLDRKSVV